MTTINTIVEQFTNVIADQVIDWGITALITYITVKSATHQYYGKTKLTVAKGIMEQGLRALLKLENNETLPDNAKVIFVEYKGRCYNLNSNKTKEKECRFFEKIRKTIAVVGGDIMGVSAYKPRDYGVLGIANILRKPILFNFQNGELFKYDSEKFIKLKTEKEYQRYVYITADGKKEISEFDDARDIMIAIPIEYNGKLIGGVTFDLQVGAKTIYQNIESNDSQNEKMRKKENNIKVLKEARRTANNLVNAYFKKKGEDI